MGSTFNPQILMEKLAKLNSSQQSIETLSHWCIFHMHKAKQVVETWDRQFHSSPREQRLAFLYLANDILQNSRRKGSEFVDEFWKFLPDALRDVIENGGEFGKSAVLRLINIWDERKVFGSRGQLLKEEFAGRHVDNTNRNGKPLGLKLKRLAGNAFDKIVSSYQVIYGGQLDEDAVLSKCRNAVSCVEKVDKEIGGDISSGQFNGTGIVEELKGQHAILRECIEQLTALESSRANLVSNLREALQEQEHKLDEVRNQLQAAQSQSEQVSNICGQLLPNNNLQLAAEQSSIKEPLHTTKLPHSFISRSVEQKTAPVMYTRQVPIADKSSSHIEEDPKSAAAAVAAKLTASTSSAEMLTYVLSSLASEGVIGNSTKESSTDYPSEKRPKIETDHSAYVPPNPPQPPPVPLEQPPPPSSPPPLPPLPPPAYPMPTQFPNVVPYGYSMTQPPPLPQYHNVVAPPFNGVSHFTASTANTYQGYQTEGGFYSQSPSLPMSPISRQ
ncbi:hypothetical protein LguiA_019743 [Lonicera macranthoides]